MAEDAPGHSGYAESNGSTGALAATPTVVDSDVPTPPVASEQEAGSVASASDDGTHAKGDTRPLIDIRSLPASVLREVAGIADEMTCVTARAGVGVVGTRHGHVCCLSRNNDRAMTIVRGGSRVHDLSLDAEGAFCACSLADGRVLVAPATPPAPGGGDTWTVEHGALPVLAVALCPDFALPSQDGHLVCAGGEDGRLVLHKRSRFGGHTVLHEGEGPVTRIAWRARLVAWANDRGVKVINVHTGQRVTYVPRPAEAELASKCHLLWSADDQLLMAWGVVVKVVAVIEVQAQTMGGQSRARAEVRNTITCSDVVLGLAATGSESICVLSAASLGSKATLHLYGHDGAVFHRADAPLLRGAFPEQLRLGFAAPHLPMYLTAPRDLIVFHVRDMLEHAVELLEFERYDEAIRLADIGGGGIQGLRHIVCLKCVAADLKARNFQQAVATVSRFRDLEPETWQECAVLFDHHGGLEHLAVSEALPVPPRGRRLPREFYDDVLFRLLGCPSALLAVLHWWPADTFTPATLQHHLRKSLPPDVTSQHACAELDDGCRCRAEALALLEALTGALAEAVRLLLALRSAEIFRFLRDDFRGERHTSHFVEQNIPELFSIDDREACALLVESRHVVAADTVVAALHGCDNRWRHEYLKQLFSQDEVSGHKHHMQMVRLFAEYEPKGLLSFLNASERYSLEDALGVCQQRGLHEEEVYLLGRLGRVGEGLAILLERLGDVRQAVLFASKYQDPKLWEFLMTFVLAHPHLLVPLLEHLEELEVPGDVGRDMGRPQPPPTATRAHVLRRLPNGTPVPRIGGSVTQVLDSYKLSSSMYMSCNRLSRQEMATRKRMFMQRHDCASVVAPSSWNCALCGRLLSHPPPTAVASSRAPSETGIASDSASQLSPPLVARVPTGIVLRGRVAVHALCHKQQLETQGAVGSTEGRTGGEPGA